MTVDIKIKIILWRLIKKIVMSREGPSISIVESALVITESGKEIFSCADTIKTKEQKTNNKVFRKYLDKFLFIFNISIL